MTSAKTPARVVYTTSGRATTIGPPDRHAELVRCLKDFSDMTSGDATTAEQLRRLAWFLGDRGETAAACAIMEHAAVKLKWAVTPWGYVQI